MVVAFAGDDCSIKTKKTVYYNDDNLDDPYYTATAGRRPLLPVVVAVGNRKFFILHFEFLNISHKPNCNNDYTQITITAGTEIGLCRRFHFRVVFSKIVESVTKSPAIYR